MYMQSQIKFRLVMDREFVFLYVFPFQTILSSSLQSTRHYGQSHWTKVGRRYSFLCCGIHLSLLKIGNVTNVFFNLSTEYYCYLKGVMNTGTNTIRMRVLLVRFSCNPLIDGSDVNWAELKDAMVFLPRL